MANPVRQAKILRPGPAAAVVVLGAQVRGPDDPAPAVRRRVAHGVEVLGRSGSAWLVLAGGVGEAGERLVLEEESASTLEQAVAVARLARERGWPRVVVVTDRYHLSRALFLFRRMGLAAGGDAARGPGGADRWRWLLGWVREAGAWAKVAGQALTGTLRRSAAAAGETRGPGEFRGSCG